jgi:hypothetical protein
VLGLPHGQVNQSTYEPVDMRDGEGRGPAVLQWHE